MTTPTPPAKAAAGPVGKDEVVAATLSAAAELFAERGPAATSIRDIATRSKVNHGLIYRHFGTKEQLVGAVLEHLGGRLTALLDGEVSDGEIEQNMDQHMRVMARALLDGYPIGELQTRFPGSTGCSTRCCPDSRMSATAGLRSPMPLPCSWVGASSSRSCGQRRDSLRSATTR